MKKMYKVLGIIAIVAVIGFSMVACDNGNGTPPGTGTNPGGSTNTSLDGVWKRGNDTQWEEITISGSSGVFSSFNYTQAIFKDAVSKGYYSIGDQYWRNLRSTGNLTWSGQYLAITYNASNPNVATGTSWNNFTFTMSADGQKLGSGNGTWDWTRQR